MAAAERITFADFQERFKTEEQCRDYLFQQRFPNGFVCPSCGAKEYYPIYRRNLCQCKKCDGFQAYPGLKNVAVDARVYDSASGDLKWLHKALSNLKAFLTGTYHGRCEQLQSYLDEYCFRFNRRRSPDQLFARLARAVAVSAVAD